MIISKTPLRISFAGGGTDLRSYYKYNRYGAVLSTSLNSYLYVTVKKQSPLFQEKYRLNYSETEMKNDLEEIKNPIIRECIRFLEIDDSLYISTISDTPGSTGLGSSSTFCVGLLNALYKFKGEAVSAGSLAEEAAFIECDVLKRPMGKQDHYAAAYGGINYIRFYDDETVTVRPIIMTNDNKNIFSDSVLMFWTGITRPSESVLKEQDRNSRSNKKILTKMKNQALDLSKILTSNDFSTNRIGVLLNKGWKYKKSLATNISNDLIDKCYEDAIKNGAIAGKISGAGGGGFLTLISDPLKHDMLTEVMKKHGLVKYRFGLDSSGTSVAKLD
jgi:D-glycero-alpha-D-manno-heptose-7-phosphate kinase